MSNKDMNDINIAIKNYCNDNIPVCHITIKDKHNGMILLKNMINNKELEYLDITSSEEEYEGCEYKYKYSPCIIMKGNDVDNDAVSIFIYTSIGEAHGLANNYLYSYNIMVNLFLGGMDNFNMNKDEFIITSELTTDILIANPFYAHAGFLAAMAKEDEKQ